MTRIALVAVLCGLLAACAGAPQPSLPSAPPGGEPVGLPGLSPASLRSMFGTPAFVRKDGGMEIWRYDGTRCRAFFFFSNQNGVVTVRHVETLPRGTAIAADSTCLDGLRAAAPRVS